MQGLQNFGVILDRCLLVQPLLIVYVGGLCAVSNRFAPFGTQVLAVNPLGFFQCAVGFFKLAVVEDGDGHLVGQCADEFDVFLGEYVGLGGLHIQRANNFIARAQGKRHF